MRLDVLTFTPGSSPRVRGAAWKHLHCHVWCRIIPACAGSSTCAASPTQNTRDHPRVCGEQRIRPSRRLPKSRIIPACAGSRSPRLGWQTARRDHPRVCGEQTRKRARIGSSPGSSPRVRGADLADVILERLHGIIPACAGSSRSRACGACRRGDHPRVCGEQRLSTLRGGRSSGSSPRVRGAVLGNGRTAPTLGIIPACAGSS